MTTRLRSAPTVIVGLLLAAIAVAWTAHVTPGPSGSAATDAAERLRLGERIYREGVLSSGRLLRGRHPGGGEVSGALAACVQCHRPSGMGTVEGNRIIPPIAGPFLFKPRAQALAELDAQHTRGPDLAHAFGRNRARAPYTDRTLARAIREGIDPADNRLELLMPRFDLDEADAHLLIDYLKQLSDRWPPGVTRDTLHFATVVAPGVDPVRCKAMLDVLSAFFAVRNSGNHLGQMRDQLHPETAHASRRAWQLHVWELSGAPETWPAQLAAYERRQPVFALLSGVSQGPWAPVQQFCETRRVPCWFPTVDLPVAAESSFYSVYFSNGVLLEAELLAHRLDELRAASDVRRVLEIRGDDEAAAGAGQALQRALGRSDLRIEERVLGKIDAAALRQALRDATSGDAIVLWLRGAEVAQLREVAAPRALVYLSATLAGAERAPLPSAWKAQARLIYPFELPERRGFGMARIRAWLEMRGLPIVDERLQSDAYLASLLMAEKVDEMLETPNRDYLLERAEAILSMRLTSALYRRLSLGPAQRLASKGGYIARFAAPDRSALVAETSWIVP